MSDYPPRLVLHLQGTSVQQYVLSKASVTLGRSTTSDIVLRDWRASRLHARIEQTPDGYEIVDPGSANGTFVNGERTSRHLLVPGDEVTIGTNLTRCGMPKIGNNVDIYVGARVLGGITIGDNAKIGANCVVTSSVAAGSIVFSAPTRTLSRRG